MPAGTPILSVSKGIETSSLMLMNDILKDLCGTERSYAFLRYAPPPPPPLNSSAGQVPLEEGWGVPASRTTLQGFEGLACGSYYTNLLVHSVDPPVLRAPAATSLFLTQHLAKLLPRFGFLISPPFTVCAAFGRCLVDRLLALRFPVCRSVVGAVSSRRGTARIGRQEWAGVACAFMYCLLLVLFFARSPCLS